MVAWVFALVHFQKRAASKRREFIKEKNVFQKQNSVNLDLKTAKLSKKEQIHV